MSFVHGDLSLVEFQPLSCLVNTGFMFTFVVVMTTGVINSLLWD